MPFKSPSLGEVAKYPDKLRALLQRSFDEIENELMKGDPIGRIVLWVDFQDPPPGWVLCDGTSYNKTRYPELYAKIGTTFGSTATTFAVPTLTAPASYVYIIRVE